MKILYYLSFLFCWLWCGQLCFGQMSTSVSMRSGVVVDAKIKPEKGVMFAKGYEPEAQVYNPFAVSLRSQVNRWFAVEATVSYHQYRYEFSSPGFWVPDNPGVVEGYFECAVNRNQLAVLVVPSFILAEGKGLSLNLFGGGGMGFYTHRHHGEIWISGWNRGQYYSRRIGAATEPGYRRTALTEIGGRLQIPINEYMSFQADLKLVSDWGLPSDRRPSGGNPIPSFRTHFAAWVFGLNFRLPAHEGIYKKVMPQ